MQVDHIVPPSKFAHKKYKNGKLVSNTSFLARAMNSSFNLTAICPKCNQQKSDKMGIYTVRGAVAKTGELAVNTTQKVVGTTLFVASKAAWGVGKVAMLPLHEKSPLPVKITYILLIVAAIYYFRRG